MNIRLISGKYGGRKIDAPSRRSTHAMSERARNALFNIISQDIAGSRVLDAFAGSGSLGLEALSRGAETVLFVEKDRTASSIIQKNIDMLNADAEVINTTVNNWVSTSQPSSFDLIFVDPPYHNPQLNTVEKLLGLLKPGALMVLSHPGKSEVPTKNGVVVVDNRSYGSLNLTLYRRESA